VRLIGDDPLALLRVLDSSVSSSRAQIERIAVPSLVVVGADDSGFRLSADDLVAALPNARLAVVPGNHTSCIGFPDLGLAIADFLTSPPGISAA
jgi:pimeloyl-ACP methyl ester carboxylesterase